MNKIITKILFFIPLIGFLIFLEYKLGHMPSSYSYKRACFEEQLDSIEILVLGNSQVLYGINPALFKLKTYNLSDVSQTIYYDAQLTLKYIDRMPKLKYIIVSVYYVSFGEQLYDGVENWRDYCYSQFWDINYRESGFFDVGRYSKIFLYTPRLSLYYLRHGFKTNVLEGFQRNGYLKKDTLSNNINISNASGQERVREHEFCYKEKRLAEIKGDFELLIAEAKKRNITPIIITPPVYKTYSDYVNQKIVLRNSLTIEEICQKYHCKYLNYFNDSRFEKDDFYDNDHLNFIGAEKLSTFMNDEIQIGNNN